MVDDRKGHARHASYTAINTMASSSPPFHRRRKSWARKIERCCCSTFAYIPLTFVYGLTTWAVWVATRVSLLGERGAISYFRAALILILYLLADVSYTIAVFTSPGSPVDPKIDAARRRNGGGYEGLPTYEDHGDIDAQDDADEGGRPAWMGMTTVTAKSTGKPRFCKKCRCVKPDRSHHCSSCGRCVLKMDHHCPWLATCVGLRNYKPFLLFLSYTSLFCWWAFSISAMWVWGAISDAEQMGESMLVVNTILLSVLSGIIGLVLSGFTGWHIYLMISGQTTIESLEKTRYLTPLRMSMERQFQQRRNYLSQDGTANDRTAHEDQPLGERLKEIHANALPGVLRPEEGDVSLRPSRNVTPNPTEGSSPASESLHRSYAEYEANRERERYHSYLDEKDSEMLPNAFDNGWKCNVLHVLGHEPFYWFLPVCNTSGDGWAWEVSQKWTEARARLESEREQRTREEAVWGRRGPSQQPLSPPPQDLKWTPGAGFVDRAARNLGDLGDDEANLQMQPLDRRKMVAGNVEGQGYETSSDEEHVAKQATTSNWNDIPDEFLNSGKGRKKGD